MTDAERHDAIFEANHDLMRYRNAIADIRHFKDGIDQLQRRLDAIAPPLDPDKIFVQHSDSSPEDLLLEIVDRQRKYTALQLDAERIAAELEWRVAHWTDGIERRILRAYYLYNLRIIRIAENEGYSYPQIKRLRRSALENYGKNLKKYSNNA